MQGQVREKDSQVTLDPDNESSLPFMTSSNHPHVVTHHKVLAQLPRLKLQWVLAKKKRREKSIRVLLVTARD